MAAESVLAIIDGRKTQTRRVVKPPKGASLINVESDSCPYGVPGDRLYVKETWTLISRTRVPKGRPHTNWYGNKALCTIFRADGDDLPSIRNDCGEPTRWASPLHLRRDQSRLTLEVVNIRVERVQEISEADAIDEGTPFDGKWWLGAPHPVKKTPKVFATAYAAFCSTWDHLNAKRGHSWASNSWVWVIEFRRLDQEPSAPGSPEGIAAKQEAVMA